VREPVTTCSEADRRDGTLYCFMHQPERLRRAA
jgi:hypothetical protein